MMPTSMRNALRGDLTRRGAQNRQGAVKWWRSVRTMPCLAARCGDADGTLRASRQTAPRVSTDIHAPCGSAGAGSNSCVVLGRGACLSWGINAALKQRPCGIGHSPSRGIDIVPAPSPDSLSACRPAPCRAPRPPIAQGCSSLSGHAGNRLDHLSRSWYSRDTGKRQASVEPQRVDQLVDSRGRQPVGMRLLRDRAQCCSAGRVRLQQRRALGAGPELRHRQLAPAARVS